MFRRRWNGLPKDPIYPSNLKDLGYFINEEDEIRSIADPDYYFKYFIDKNFRVNDRQRFHFNEAIQDVVHERLQKEGLNKVLLPLNTTDSSQPHTTIFASADIQSKSRIVVIFGEPRQMLGVLALRVLNGPGGVNKGSLVSIVKKLQAQATSATDPSPPGIVLADVGSVFWWPEKRKALTLNAFAEMPLPSMVHNGRRITDDNRIPGSESSEKNVEHMLREVLPALANEKARFDFIGIGRGADILEQQLDQKDLWDCWAKRINTISILGGSIPSSQLHNEELKTFLSKRAHAYIVSEKPLDTPLVGAHGSPEVDGLIHYGTAVALSAGEPAHEELIMIKAGDSILAWLEEVARVGHEVYRHPEILVMDHIPSEETSEEQQELVWE